jgi:hypothetical protein
MHRELEESDRGMSEIRKPQPFDVYRHYKGQDYLVLSLALRESDREEMVVYSGQGKEQIWVRPVSEFQEKFTYLGTTSFRYAADRMLAETVDEIAVGSTHEG